MEEADLPPFTNQSGRCARCGGRRLIRVPFDRACARARGDHFHRRCPCGHEWIGRCSPWSAETMPGERLGAPAVRVAASEYVKQRAERGRRKEPRADTERRCYCPGTAARQFKTESVTQRATRTFDFDAPVTRQKPCVGPGPVPAPDASPGWLVRGR